MVLPPIPLIPSWLKPLISLAKMPLKASLLSVAVARWMWPRWCLCWQMINRLSRKSTAWVWYPARESPCFWRQQRLVQLPCTSVKLTAVQASVQTVPLQALHQGRRFSKSTALDHMQANALGHRLAEAAETRLAQKTGATAEHIDGAQPIRQKREVGERRQLRRLRGIC